MKRKILNEDGFTILEVMVAGVIISLSLLMLLNMSMVALDSNEWSRNTTASTQAMQEKIENLLSDPENLENGSDSINGVMRQWEVSSEAKFLKRATVVVTWKDHNEKIHYDSMVAFIRTDSL